MRYRPVLLAFLAAVCLGAATAVQAQSQDPMAQLVRQWSSTVNAGDYAATAALYTPDAIIYAPGLDPARGTDAILANLQSFKGFTVKTTLVGSKMASDMGAMWGTFKLSGHDKDGKTVSQSGPWMDVVVRGKDGSWKIYREMWNSTESTGM